MNTATQISEAPPQERYLFKPFFGSSHWWTMNILDSIPTPLKTLDIGSGSGAMGMHLRSKNWSNVDAIEIDPKARAHVKDIYRDVFPSLDKLQEKDYQLVLLLDVLEHLTNPKEFLIELKEYLAPQARILISVPNVAHWSLRLSLLFGVWNYTERGLLDKTHVHFFNIKHLRETINSIEGTKINSLSGSISPAEFVIPKRFHDTLFFKTFGKMRHWGSINFTGLAAYQLLADISICASSK